MDYKKHSASERQSQTRRPSKDVKTEKNPKLDSCISMTSDSGVDICYKSTDIPDSSEELTGQTSSGTVSDVLKQKESSYSDSGLDIGYPYTSESDSAFITPVKSEQISSWPKVYDQDSDGDTKLHLEIVEARSDVIFPLIRQAPHPDFLDICNDLCQTPLHLAVLTGKSNIVRRLVVAGATLDLQDHHGNTALHISARNGDLDCVQAILQNLLQEEIEAAKCPYNVYPQPHDLSSLINMKNYDGLASIHLASMGGFKKVLECLSDSGADVNNQEGKNGKTALHLAVESGNFELIQILVTKCHANVTAKNYANQTPLFVAWSLCKKKAPGPFSVIFEFLKRHSSEKWELPSESESSLSDEEE